MTNRQLVLIDERMYRLNKINEAAEVDLEAVMEIINKYRVESFYKDIEKIFQYLPDAILDLIVDELEGKRC